MKNIINKLNEELKNNSSAVMVTCVKASSQSPVRCGFKMLVLKSGETFGTVGGGTIEKKATEIALNTFNTKISQLVDYNLDEDNIKMSCGGKASLFFEYFSPKKRLFIFGAGHIGTALASIMKLMEYEVFSIDNRKQNLINVNIDKNSVNNVYSDYIKSTLFTNDDNIVICTHKHEYDFEILNMLVNKELEYKYLGMIGSKNKVKQGLKNLKIKPKKLYSPIGINIATKNSKEIALAIAAEIIAINNNVNKLEFCYKKIME